MKVKELIAALSELDPEMKVYTHDSSYYDCEVEGVEAKKITIREYMDGKGYIVNDKLLGAMIG